MSSLTRSVGLGSSRYDSPQPAASTISTSANFIFPILINTFFISDELEGQVDTKRSDLLIVRPVVCRSGQALLRIDTLVALESQEIVSLEEHAQARNSVFAEYSFRSEEHTSELQSRE